jgi:hypothetical protein
LQQTTVVRTAGFKCRPQMALFGDDKSVSEYSDFVEVDDFTIAADNEMTTI